MGQNQKWLVSFLYSITPTQWVFLIMGSMTVFFIKLMMNYYERANQRKFKPESQKGNSSSSLIKRD